MEENTQKEFLDLNDVVKYKNFDDKFIVKNIIRVNDKEFYNIRLNNPEKKILRDELEEIKIPRDKLIFLYNNKNNSTKETKSLSPILKNKLIVIISINIHGKVNSLDRVFLFPSNFKHTFWKNIGVCGKMVAYNKNIGEDKPAKTHQKYVELITSLKNVDEMNVNKLFDNKQIISMEKNMIYNKDIPYKNDSNARSMRSNTNKLFYTQTPTLFCKNKYKCNPEYIQFINKPYIDTPKYLDKNLYFGNDVGSLYITIIDEKQESDKKQTSWVMNSVDDLTKVTNYIYERIENELTPTMFPEFKPEIIKKIDCLLQQNNFLLNDLFSVFEFLKLIDYEIDLFLLDYSCSTILTEKSDNPDFKKKLVGILNNNDISKGGKRKTIRHRPLKVASLRKTRNNKKTKKSRKTKCRR
jgi:hypothetical protein